MQKKLLFFLIASVFLGACREHTLISSKISPVNDTASLATDTLYNCMTSSFFRGDIVTSTNVSGISVNQAIGAFTDSFFGTTTASTFFQIVPPSTGLAFDTSWHFDSAFLWVPYASFSYGDTANKTLTQAYQVYYLADSLGFNSVYYAGSDKAVDVSRPLSQPVTINLHALNDSVNADGANREPAMRIRLNAANIIPLITNAVAATSGESDEQAAFLNAFKGICIRPADSRNTTTALPYFRLEGTDIYDRAAVHVYYHRTNATITAPLEFYFYQGACAHFNKINRNYSRYPVNELFKNTANSDIVALQNGPGSSIDLIIPGINSKIPKNVLINKAELQISLLPNLNSTKNFVPDQIFVMGVGNGTYPSGVTSGEEYYVEDRKPLGSLSPYTILDGTSHTINYGTTSISTYTIGIPREVMASIKAGNDTLHLHINGSQLFYGANRMLAAGGKYPDPKYKTKLIVVYSSLKN